MVAAAREASSSSNSSSSSSAPRRRWRPRAVDRRRPAAAAADGAQAGRRGQGRRGQAVVKKKEKKTKSLAPAPPPARECSALETRPGTYPQSDFKTGTYTQADLVMARRLEAVVSEDPVHEMKAEVDKKQADVDAATAAKEKAEKAGSSAAQDGLRIARRRRNGYVSRNEWGEGLRENLDEFKKVFVENQAAQEPGRARQTVQAARWKAAPIASPGTRCSPFDDHCTPRISLAAPRRMWRRDEAHRAGGGDKEAGGVSGETAAGQGDGAAARSLPGQLKAVFERSTRTRTASSMEWNQAKKFFGIKVRQVQGPRRTLLEGPAPGRTKAEAALVISDAEYQKLVDMKQQYEVLVQTCKLSDGEARATGSAAASQTRACLLLSCRRSHSARSRTSASWPSSSNSPTSSRC